MAPRKGGGRKSAAKRPAAPKASTKQRPLATGDIDVLPQHAFRIDQGEALPPQKYGADKSK